MPQEIGEFIKYIHVREKNVFGDLEVFVGNLKSNSDINISIAWSGWGKVSAARAITRMIGLHTKNSQIDLIIFTGVAGAINKDLLK